MPLVHTVMPKSCIEEILKESLGAISSEFRDNELAYLALTTKIKNPVRDRWAFQLYRKLRGRVVVSREWKRTDIALLEKAAPTALVELKAMYTFDAVLKKHGVSGYIQAMEEDESKARKLAQIQTQIYTVLLATHPKSIVPRDLDGVVKYRSGINRAAHNLGSPENVLKEAVSAIKNKLQGKNVVSSGILNGGQAFGINADVLFWMVKA